MLKGILGFCCCLKICSGFISTKHFPDILAYSFYFVMQNSDKLKKVKCLCRFLCLLNKHYPLTRVKWLAHGKKPISDNAAHRLASVKLKGNFLLYFSRRNICRDILRQLGTTCKAISESWKRCSWFNSL